MPNPFQRFGRVEGMNSKSTALSPILWMLGVFFTGTGSLYWITGKEVVLYFGFAIIVIILIFALYAYNHFMKTDPDCLRSEKFKLSKMAMEKGHIGDNTQKLQTRQQALSTKQEQEVIEVGGSDD